MYSTTRIKIFNGLIIVLIALLLIMLAKVQILNGNYYKRLSEDNRIRLIPVKTTRAQIFDRNGHVLADNEPSFDLYVIPDDFFMESSEELSHIIDLPVADIRKKIKRSVQPSFRPVLLKKNLTPAEVQVLEERNIDFGGTFIQVVGKRYYPWRDVAAQVIGYIGKISKSEYAEKKYIGYLIDDYVGRMGIEYLFEEVLRGVHGGKQIEVNSKGMEIRELAYKPPLPGTPLHLTIDIELQARIHDKIRDEVASVCLMNIKTGEILVLASAPSFDPNAFVVPQRSNERLALLKDKSLPFLNRVVSSRYPPGSVFKVVTALAALEAGVITPNTTLICKGTYQLNDHTRKFHCWSSFGHGEVNLEKALQQSCNIYFYRVGRMLGADGIARFAKKIRLGEPVSIELPRVAKGIIPSTEWKRKHLREPWYQGETLHYAIGQGYVAVTPLQVLRLISIIANNGMVVEPTIIQGVKHKPYDISIKQTSIDAVKRGMFKAVETKYGTAHNARVAYFKMAGKTGTAETTGEPHSWFAGYFPYNNPQVAVVVVVEHGGVGGGKAAKIANATAVYWYDRYAKNIDNTDTVTE